MAIEVICDDCGNKYRLGDDKAGSRVKCRECGARIDVPEDDVTEIVGRPRSSGGKKKRAAQSDGPPLGIIIGGVAVLAVFGIGALFFFMNRGGGNPVVQNPPPFPNTPVVPGTTPLAGQSPASALPSSTLPASTLPNTTVPGSLPSTLPNTPVANNPGVAPQPANTLPNSGPPKLGPAAQGAGFANAGENGAAGAAPDEVPQGLNPVVWNVKPDPIAGDIKIDPTKNLNLNYPKDADVKDIVYPATPSTFVAVGTNGFFGGTREFFNLATKSRVGQLQAKGYDGAAALSPDGKYFAALKRSGGVSLDVWETKSGKELGRCEISGNVFSVQGAFFSSPTRLGVLSNEGFKGSVKTWKLPEGEPERVHDLGSATEFKEIGISPNGKYLAAVTEKYRLKFFDLDNGDVAGELPLLQPARFGGGEEVDAICFSPDGEEFALILKESNEFYFMRFAMADAKLLAMRPLTAERAHQTDNYGVLRLQYFPNKKRLLWRGHHVIDSVIGGPVWSAPIEDNSSEAPRLLVGDDKILIAAGTNRNSNLKLVPVPIKEIDNAAKVVASGGEASDAGLPPLTKGDVSDAQIITPAASINWTMQPDPAPAGKVLKNAVALPKDRPFVGGAFVSRNDAARAAVWYTEDGVVIMTGKGIRTQTNAPPLGGKGTIVIDTFDLTSGRALKPLPITYNAVVQSMSPDGDFVSVRTQKPNEQRLDIYQLSTGKPVAGWRPYSSEASDNNKAVSSSFLIDSEHCITQNFHHIFRQADASTYIWKLPECKALFRLPGLANVTLSPGGKYLGAFAENKFFFMEAKTGNLVGEILMPLSNIMVAFHPTGTHLAVLGTDQVSHRINIIDVATGKATADFYVPNGNEQIQWSGDTAVLLDGTYLVDLKQQKVGWMYSLPSGTHLTTQPDLSHWTLIGNGPFPTQVMLSSAVLPEKPVAERIASTMIPDNALLKPGMQVGLQINLGALPPERPNMAKEVYDRFKAGLEKNGFQVVQGAPAQFTITTAQSNTGENQEFRVQLQTTSIPVMKVDAEIAFLLNGQSAWKTTHTATNRGGFIVFTRGEDLATHLAKGMWDNVSAYLMNFHAPAQIFGNNSGNGLGTSILVPGGAQTQR